MVHVADVTAEQAYIERDPAIVAAVELGGARTIVFVPMLKEDELIGVFSHVPPRSSSIYRQADCAGQNFAAQAVIAIENARL